MTHADRPRIHVERRGPEQGPSLVMLHGVGRNGRDFAPLLPWLTERPVWLWDHRGHGRSDRAASYFVRDYAADLTAWLAESTSEPVDLYGHSLGALTAVVVAAAQPDRVRSVILEDPPSPGFLRRLASSLYCHNFPTMQRLAGSTDDVAAIAAELAEVRLGLDPNAPRMGDVRDAAALRFSARCLQSVDPAVFAPLLQGRWLDGVDLAAELAAICAPVLLLHGDERCGGMLPADDAQGMSAQLRHPTVVRLAEAGHLLHWQRLEETVRAVLSFLESL